MKSGFANFLNRNSGLGTESTQSLVDELDKREMTENPYPLDVFHPEIKPYINWLHSKQGYDIPGEFIGSCLLSAWSTAIGTSYAVSTNMKDKFYLSVWMTLLGIASSGKSMCISKIFGPLFNIQSRLDAEWEDVTMGRAEHELKYINMPTVVFRDSHIATLVRSVLPDNPKGVLKHTDEILEWVNGFDQLSKKEGTDTQFWLSTWNSSPFSAIRSGKVKWSVRRPFVNVIGGAQYETVHKLFLKDRDTSGFIFRVLFAKPPHDMLAVPNPRFEMPREYEFRHEAVLTTMWEKMIVERDDDMPNVCLLTPDSTRLFEEWNAVHVKRINNLEDRDERSSQGAVLGKIKEYALRFAAILRIADKMMDAKIDHSSGYCLVHMQGQEPITSDVMERALRLADYYFRSGREVYAMVRKEMVAPKDVITTSFLLKANKSTREIARVILGSDSEASRKKMERLIKKWVTEYPRVFGALNKG